MRSKSRSRKPQSYSVEKYTKSLIFNIANVESKDVFEFWRQNKDSFGDELLL